ncbi:metallophosphoesterase [Maritimibacter sp. DP1N21-5]|uniref:metallophosphoesterase n=1 Tax=Maritimibacter sp. DP1N21-5 TaxID=2836867 RepID=UPI001C47792E|nr:metallophosphoesterase [Maritimibacter sp. DP1N21-5]MBV7411062.1 metallophosphoesterase [Maritimibacter sp. DP1N21-5]
MNLFDRWRQRWARATPADERPGSDRVFDAAIAPDRPLAVIGDVHGMSGLLDRLLDRLGRDFPEAHVVTVGDYIDRGDGSRGVIERLRPMAEAGTVTCLMGNHEVMLFEFLAAPDGDAKTWLSRGGLQMLASYGVGGVVASSDAATRRDAARRLQAAMGSEVDWLRTLPLTYRSGNVHVVHAAADPNRAMDRQQKDALLWGHPDFDRIDRADGQWVIHGHSVVDRVEARRGRIPVDTGAYATGRLSAAVVTPAGDLEVVEVSA